MGGRGGGRDGRWEGGREGEGEGERDGRRDGIYSTPQSVYNIPECERGSEINTSYSHYSLDNNIIMLLLAAKGSSLLGRLITS